MLTTGLAWTTSDGATIAAALTAGIGAGVGARTGFGRTGPPHVEQYLYSSGLDAPHVVQTPFALALAAADAAVGACDAAGV